MKKRASKFGWASMTSRGANWQFVVAIGLITVIPALTLVYLISNGGMVSTRLSPLTAWVIGLCLAGCVLLGYVILSRYPRTVIRLRQHLVDIARGELPDTVRLPDDESDINAVENYLNLILSQMKERMATIEHQQGELVEAAQKQAMMVSLCTACHHIAQPASVINVCLELLKTEHLSDDGRSTLDMSIQAADAVTEVCKRLNNVSVYRPEQCGVHNEASTGDIRLLDVGIKDGTPEWTERFLPDIDDAAACIGACAT